MSTICTQSQGVRVIVYVAPKKNVLDPQGAAVGHAMVSLGYETVTDVRVGKTIEFEIEGEDTPAMRALLDSVCDQLLSNPIIEDFRYEIVAQ